MTPTKYLVVYYSRTGVTQRLGDAIAEVLGARHEAIVDRKDRSGPLGFMSGGKDALLGKATGIEPIKNDPAQYDLVLIGTPVWAGTVTPAVRSYLAAEADRLPQVAFFLTTNKTGTEKTFEAMAELAGKAPVATLGLRSKQIKRAVFADDVREFATKLNVAMGDKNQQPIEETAD
jgi:flavodoxin